MLRLAQLQRVLVAFEFDCRSIDLASFPLKLSF